MPSLIDQLRIFKSAAEGKTLYFRIGDADENVLETTSVEVSTHHVGTPEDVLDLYLPEGIADVPAERERVKASFETYDPKYPDNFFSGLSWQDEGHRGAGFYYQGACACETLEELFDYDAQHRLSTERSVIHIFEGDDLGYCEDGNAGSVILPRKKFMTLPISILADKTLVRIIDSVACGVRTLVNGEVI